MRISLILQLQGKRDRDRSIENLRLLELLLVRSFVPRCGCALCMCAGSVLCLHESSYTICSRNDTVIHLSSFFRSSIFQNSTQ